MNYSFTLPLALGFSWILSPESLVIAGNVAGQVGWMSLLALAGVLLLFTACSRLLGNSHLPAVSSREFLILQRGTGSISAATLSIAAYLPLTIVAGTALLVTAGYTFNEVFLYWFPNFGFAFLLLALLTTLQFFRQEIALRAQVCFIGMAAGCLLLLSLYGVTGAEKAVVETAQQPGSFSPFSATLLLLLFVGCSSSHKQERGPLLLVPALAFCILFLWMLASLYHVTPDRLASSTIPYMTAARKILGEPGRQIMGVAIISGTCGALNGLMILTRTEFTTLATEGAVPQFLSTRKQNWFIPLFLAVIIGVLMATGLAGDELLESLLRGALILWLLYYTFLCLAALHLVHKATAAIPYPALFCTLLLMAGSITLLVGDPRRVQINLFILSVLSASGLLCTCWYFINKQNKDQGNLKEETV